MSPQAVEIEVAGAIVFRDDGAVLLVKRGRAPSAGTWSLPGGRIEQGETPEAAAVREVREETGLVVHEPRHLEIVRIEDSDVTYLIHEIVCEISGDAIALVPGDDAAAAEWVHDLETYGATAAVQGVVSRARALRATKVAR